METHEDAIAFLAAHGLAAVRRAWQLGDTVEVIVVPHEPRSSGIVLHEVRAWLAPAGARAWDLVQVVRELEYRVAFESLGAACAATLRRAALHDLHDECPSCGGPRSYSFGEALGARFWLCTACSRCGVLESDGMGSLPDELRRLELERHGTWSVEIDGSQQTAGWSKIREALSLSMSALQELRRRLPGSIFQGTLAEALTLQGELTRAGVKSRVVGRRPVEP